MTASAHFGIARQPANLVVAGPGVKGERSESRSDAAGAVDARTGGHTIPAAGDGDRAHLAPGQLMERLLLSPEEAAEVLGVSRSRVYDLMRKRELVSVRIGRCRRVPVSAVRRFVDQLTEDAWLS
jgi:excisionase family DNA binding protein